jgi:hypothetical protein
VNKGRENLITANQIESSFRWQRLNEAPFEGLNQVAGLEEASEVFDIEIGSRKWELKDKSGEH